VAGEDHKRLLSEGKILSDHRPQIHDEFMPSNEAAEVALEGYMPMVDAWFRDIKARPEKIDRREATFRMMAAMFVGGVLIHPARDGNGQTFKGLILSYMHDLLPDHQERFVPIKYDRDHHNSTHEMAISFMGGGFLAMENDLTSGAVPDIEPKSDKDKRIVEYIDRANEIQYRTPYLEGESFEYRDTKVQLALSAMINEFVSELKMPQIAEREIIRYTLERKFFFLKRKIPVYMPIINSFKRGCLDYFRAQKYPTEQARVTVSSPTGEKIDRASNAARQLMGTEDGRRVLTQYVLTGSAQIEDEHTLTNELFRKAIKMIGRQEDSIRDTLETKEEHQRRHEDMLKLLT